MRKDQIALLLAAIAFVGAAAWYRQRSSQERPFPNMAHAEVLPSSEFLNASASMDYYRDRIRQDPDVVAHYVALAQLYLQQARATSDETKYVPMARDMIEQALRRDPSNYHALLLKASLLNKLHQFEQARDLARQLLARHNEHAYTYGVLVDALVELGQYEEAIAACDRMISIRPDVGSYARAAYLRELHGDAEGAIAAMRLAADAGQAGREDRAWALYQLGNLYLNEGDLERARFLYHGILEERPGFTQAIVGLAHVKLAEGQPAEGVALLNEAFGKAPTPSALEVLAEAYAVLGDDKGAAAVAGKIRQGFRDAAAMGENVDMELADFLADEETDLAEALRLAKREHERRPDHLHALETYAWALYKNGRASEAIPLIQRAMRLDTGDAMVHYRAGRIYEAAGEPSKAVVELNRALEANLHIDSGSTAVAARNTLTLLRGTASRSVALR